MNMIKLFLFLTLITGVIYPLSVTLIGKVFFTEKASGSLILEKGKSIGSALLAQKFERDDFFHSRPSAGDFSTVASGASQAGVTQLDGHEKMEKRKLELPTAGADYWTTSGSGLDPHISPVTALAQMPRVAVARGMSETKLTELILSHTEGPTFGILGQPRVNVLELNRDLLKE